MTLFRNIYIYIYADDTAILITTDTDEQLQLLIYKFVSNYSNRCLNNYINFNPKKSYFLLFNSSAISLSGSTLDNPRNVKYLSILTDEKLNSSK